MLEFLTFSFRFNPPGLLVFCFVFLLLMAVVNAKRQDKSGSVVSVVFKVQ